MSEPRPWQVLASETVLDAPPWLSVVRQAVRLPNGTHIDDYWLTPGRDYALVVGATDAGEVLLVRQYKHGLGRVLLEFPAGYLDAPGEDPLAAAQRELREETGYAAAHWTALGAYCLDANRSATCAHLFAARGLRRVSEPRLEATETLVPLLVPAAELPALLRSGAMPTLASAAAWGLAAAVLFNTT